ncbi:MAG: serine/threonine protein kinase [Myxococcales bacterium]|nr:serine/threonine protein kinase [Myxococcales bacterium]
MHTSGIVVGGNYVVGPQIGEGGMGVVYEATQWSLARTVAVKLPRPELCSYPFVLDRFRTEALAGSRLRHPNLVSVIDYGHEHGMPFLVTELVVGRLLGQLVAHEPLELETIVELGEQVLAALGEAHAAGVIHGDVKCDNVLVETVRTGLRARLIDFGLASIADAPSLIGAERILSGTPEYLAPEVIRGEPPTCATDIYAVGVMLYQLLTGTTPFSGGSTRDLLRRHVTEDAIPPSQRARKRPIPQALDEVVMRALAKDPAERHEDADACAAALRASRPAIQRRVDRPFELALVDTSDTIMAAYRDLVQSGLLQAYEQTARAPTVALAGT